MIFCLIISISLETYIFPWQLIASEYDKKLPQLQTSDHPMVPRGKNSENRQPHDSKKQSKMLCHLSNMIAKIERTLQTTPQDKTQHKPPTLKRGNNNQ